MGGSPTVRVHTFSGQAAVTLAADDLEATFLPELSMLGVSLRHRGLEYLSLHGGVEAFLDGHTTGLPFLHPWANRLSARRYAVGDTEVDLDGIDLHTDAHGLPMHGTMLGAKAWDLSWTDAGTAAASLRAHFDYGAHPDLLRSFPFPHEITMEATVDGALSVTTTVRPTGPMAVPISFGYHPYFVLPDVERAEVRLTLPRRQRAALDARQIPTGSSALEPAESEPVGDRTFDDLYALGEVAQLSVEGGGHRLVIQYDRGYPFAQLYLPEGEPFAAIEPMTALTDALVTGGCPLVSPGDVFRARFTISITEG
jgi:galactose mutarotase-like enzyme